MARGGKNTKGDEKERNLVQDVDEAGLGVLRAPSSGSATGRDLPDLLVGYPIPDDGFAREGALDEGYYTAQVYGIEGKTSSGDPIYIPKEEVEALRRFCRRFGAHPKIGVRFNAEYGDPHYGNDEDNGWRFFDPEDLHDAGKNLRVKKVVALSEGDRLEDL